MRLTLPLVFALSLPGSALAEGGARPSARDLHAAECVAALDAHTHTLADQVKAGQETLRTLLMDRLVAGAAFVGDAYLHGDSDEAGARALAEQAREAQKQLSPAALRARQNACADEGAKLYADGNGLQKAVVKRVAKRRMDRLLATQ